jgi:hypothetical protein
MARSEAALRVVEGFVDLKTGVRYEAGFSAPLSHRTIRNIALANPQWFRIQHEEEELDVGWLKALHERLSREEDEEEKRREAARRGAEKEQLDLVKRRKQEEDRKSREYRRTYGRPETIS